MKCSWTLSAFCLFPAFAVAVRIASKDEIPFTISRNETEVKFQDNDTRLTGTFDEVGAISGNVKHFELMNGGFALNPVVHAYDYNMTPSSFVLLPDRPRGRKDGARRYRKRSNRKLNRSPKATRRGSKNSTNAETKQPQEPEQILEAKRTPDQILEAKRTPEQILEEPFPEQPPEEPEQILEAESKHVVKEKPTQHVGDNSTWGSGHQIIFLRHALSVGNIFGLFASNPLKGLNRVRNAARDSCRQTCACLPYSRTKKGKILASCTEDVEKENFVIRDSLLSEKGMRRASKKIGYQLRIFFEQDNITVTKFLVSPMRRTLQTSLALFRHIMKGNVDVLPNLHEAYLSLSDLAYGSETSLGFVEALQEHFKEESDTLISNSTMDALKKRLDSVRYDDELTNSYEINSEGAPIEEKLKTRREDGRKVTSFTPFFHKRMDNLRSQLLSMEKGTYVIVSHGGIGQFFFPGHKLANLGTIIGELNGNVESDLMFHNFTQAVDWSVHAVNIPGWRDEKH